MSVLPLGMRQLTVPKIMLPKSLDCDSAGRTLCHSVAKALLESSCLSICSYSDGHFVVFVVRSYEYHYTDVITL